MKEKLCSSIFSLQTSPSYPFCANKREMELVLVSVHNDGVWVGLEVDPRSVLWLEEKIWLSSPAGGPRGYFAPDVEEEASKQKRRINDRSRPRKTSILFPIQWKWTGKTKGQNFPFAKYCVGCLLHGCPESHIVPKGNT